RIEEQPRGGRLNVRFEADMTRCIQRIVDEDCTLSLRAINTELRRRMPEKPQVHERTIGKHLDGMLYWLELSRILPADRNRPDVIEGRHEYANCFLEEANIHHPVFIDECGFNIWTARSQGRARVGERAYRQVCGQKGRNLTICLAVSQVFGLVHHSDHTIQMGGMTRESFTEFLAGTATHLDENDTQYLIFDGAPAHRRPEQPRDNADLRILAPYSPFLNIVEQTKSCVKASIKTDISRLAMQEHFADRNVARNAHLPLDEYRK
ncbi:Hypothetical predicted protein, partial [Paramuricea clavata]